MRKRKNHRNTQSGFTLVEVAIVLVIIGLLVGGILKGQEMIKNAKVKNFTKQADELRAAVNTYRDRYRIFPGDDNDPVGKCGLGCEQEQAQHKRCGRYVGQSFHRTSSSGSSGARSPGR